MKINSVKIISLLFFVLSAFYLYTAYQIQVFSFDEDAPFNAKTFPIYIVDDWKDLNVKDLEKQYDSFSWDNWNQLDFETYCRKVGL